MKPNYYLELSEEVKLLHHQIMEAAKEIPQIQSLYKGCQILFSPLLHQPKILLIGFNPGGGYFNWHGKIVEEFQPLQKLEYYLNNHPLGEQTKSLFRQVGREKDLQHHTVKTNFYYWATDNLNDFKGLMKILPEELSRKLFHQSRIWTKRLIDNIKPEMIVAEGFKAFDEIAVLFSQKLHEVNSESIKSFGTPEGLKVLGYKRNQGSIIDKECIIKKLHLKNYNDR